MTIDSPTERSNRRHNICIHSYSTAISRKNIEDKFRFCLVYTLDFWIAQLDSTTLRFYRKCYFYHNFDLGQQNLFFGQNFHFWPKISIFDQKFQFLTKNPGQITRYMASSVLTLNLWQPFITC